MIQIYHLEELYLEFKVPRSVDEVYIWLVNGKDIDVGSYLCFVRMIYNHNKLIW